MAKYLTQKMSSGTIKAITYYRKQSAHPSHDETGKFTQNAIDKYAQENKITDTSKVEQGKFMSDQGVPTGGTTEEI